MRHRAGIFGISLLWLTVGLSAAFPKPNGYVNDFAGILDQTTKTALSSQLSVLEKDTSTEVAVVTVKSLDGMSVEEYAVKLFADWGIGKKDKDNGVLLLVAPAEHDVRIEVGYGLEGALPDGLAGDIIRTDIIPRFKANDFPGGVARGVDRIARIVRKEPGASTIAPSTDAPRTANGPPLLFVVPFLGVFVFIGWFAIGLGLRTKTIGTLIFGGMFGLMPGIFLLAIKSALATSILGPLGLFALAWGYRKGHSESWKQLLRDQKDAYHDERKWTWQMGSGSSGSSGGSSSGGSSSSGGGSFGGGSSGGGGASGHW